MKTMLTEAVISCSNDRISIVTYSEWKSRTPSTPVEDKDAIIQVINSLTQEAPRRVQLICHGL